MNIGWKPERMPERRRAQIGLMPGHALLAGAAMGEDDDLGGQSSQTFSNIFI